MTIEQAREILSAFRPGTDDERDPVFAEALALAQTDPELKAWFQDSQGFDRLFRADLARVMAPSSLRDAILAEAKIIRPTPWWQWRLKSEHWAAAAAVALIGAAIAVWMGSRPASFQEFGREMTDQSWGLAPHVQYKASSMAEVRRSLHESGAPSQFAVPPTLAPAVRGYSVMHWRGHEVPMICFNADGQHVHLLVVERTHFPDAPSVKPQVDEWQVWRTASWSRDDFSYVLTGLNTPSFVKKFRKSKRWDWEG